MAEIEWQEEFLDETLKDGTRVRAKCCYWAKDICVEMISPYPKLRTGRHILYMAPLVFTKDNYWHKRALELIEELVDKGRWMDAHASEVCARRAEAKRRIAIAQSHIDRLKADRRSLKQQLKSGVLSQKEFQKQVIPINKAIRELDLIKFDEQEERWLKNS